MRLACAAVSADRGRVDFDGVPTVFISIDVCGMARGPGRTTFCRLSMFCGENGSWARAVECGVKNLGSASSGEAGGTPALL